MQINLNGKPETIVDNISMVDLIQQLELQDKRIAIEVNESLLPRSAFADYLLKENDQIEIVHAIGGG